ncbi:MAG: hypothetical protein R3F61_07055 [Myxococcota bacterium]
MRRLLPCLLLVLHACGLWLTEEELCDERVDRVRWYVDIDGDGFGDPAIAYRCEEDEGFVDNADDCDDADPAIGTAESIGVLPGFTQWCRDEDQDGVGRSDDCVFTCSPPAGYEAPTSGDCDDQNPLFTVLCPWVDTAAERQANCALRTDGTIACWGNDEAGLVSEVLDDSRVYVAMDVGRDVACALRDDGRVRCWGLMGVNPGADLEATEIAVGWGAMCALDTEGQPACWASTMSPFPNAASSVPSVSGLHGLTMDEGAACALDADGRLTCWGDPEWSEMLDAVPRRGGYVRVALGHQGYNAYGCAIREDRTLDCWGAFPGGGVPGGDTFVDVAVGGGQALAVRADGTIRSFGLGVNDPDLTDAVAVAAGDTHACATRTTGEISCWGDDVARQTDVPVPGLVSLDAGGPATCGTTRVGGDLRCWGDISPAPPLSFDAIDTAGEFRCAVRDTGRLDCWSRAGAPLDTVPTGAGYRDVYVGAYLLCFETDAGALQCQRPEGAFVSTPAGTDWLAVEVSREYACGLDGEGRIYCWGNAQLAGHPTSSGYVDISTGGGHACVLDAAGAITCWGEFVDEENQPSAPWVPPTDGGFVEVSSGFQLDCARRASGEVVCWGANGPGPSPTETDFIAMEAGGYSFGCGIRANGEISCWGFAPDLFVDRPPGPWSEIRVDDSGFTTACVRASDGRVACWGVFDIERGPDDDLTSPSLGSDHGCALWRDEVRCFGADDRGQADPPAGSFTSVATGGDTSCALDRAGQMVCWGDLPAGMPPAPGSMARIAPGDRHVCGLHTDGTVECWGDISAPPTGAWATLDSGRQHTCALASDGSVACWGSDEHGQSTVPAGLSRAVQVAAGDWHTCALGEDGFATCWGLDTYGQATAPRVRYTQLTAGGEHTCGLRLDGLPWCWGRDLEGQASPPSYELLLGE